MTVGALAVVNATGSVTVGRTQPFLGGAVGARRRIRRARLPLAASRPMRRQVRLKFRDKPRAGENTTIAVIATDAVHDQGGRQAAGDLGA